MLGAVPLKEPLTGEEINSYDKGSPSTSVPDKVIATGVSSSVDTDCWFAAGASLMGFTVMLTVATEELTVPSLTTKLKLSDPL